MSARVPQPFNFDMEPRISLNLNAKFELDLESRQSNSPEQSETAISPLLCYADTVKLASKKRTQPTKSDFDEVKYEYAIQLIKRLKL